MKKYKVGVFPMCADILHAGHIVALQEAKAQCEKLIVALNTHPDGKSPVQSVYERYVQLSALECVDEVIPYQGKKDFELVAATLAYDVRFLGNDYVDKEWDGKKQEEARGIQPCFLSRELHPLSSTNVKNRIIEAAKKS